MNCSYRIIKDVHIGVRVRKTKDKSTVPFKNEPMTGVKIIAWNELGFKLSHVDLPKDIWVDFYQLPLDSIQLEYGVIKNPITFVEQIIKGGSMILVRADTLDYMEMIHDKKNKDESPKYGVKDLAVGDRVISCLCKDGNVMVYLGTFSIASTESKELSRYNFSSRHDRNVSPRKYTAINSTPERVYFAYELEDGTYQINGYPITNKTILEMYKCEDKGTNKTNSLFCNINENLNILRNCFHTSQYSWTIRYESEEEFKKYLNIKYSFAYKDYSSYIQIGRENVRKNAFEYLKNSEDLIGYDKTRLYETIKELDEAHYKKE